MLDVRSVSRSYGDFKAVDEVSFTVARGEIVGLLGHNGAGKTTIMKMLSGYLEPDSGSIEFKGTAITRDRKQLQRELGYLPENLPVYPELSVASYLDYAAELKGIHRNRKRQAIRQVIEATDLGNRLLSPIATLSRGLKQRVGVAQAILGQPTLLILDEPTNGLDPAQTELMRQLIRDISASATVILSTHIMQEVEAVCDRALIVRGGRLAVDARLAELTHGNRIRLRSHTDIGSLRKALETLPWSTSIAPTAKTDEHVLSIDTDRPITEAIALTVTKLVDAGLPVQGIQPDVRDLQSLFLEVNATKVNATDVKAGENRKSHSNAGEVTHAA